MKCQQNECRGELKQSKYVLLSDPPKYQYKCLLCDHRYVKTEGENNLHSHFDQQYGGD